MSIKYTQEEIELFAQEYALNGDRTGAYRKAKPNSKAKDSSVYSQASRMALDPEIQERVKELQNQAKVKAESSFGITVEQRLKWLQEIVEAGKEVYLDQLGNKRRENLAASRAAIATMNDMLGTTEDDEENKAQPLEIKFTISNAKGRIETTNVSDNE